MCEQLEASDRNLKISEAENNLLKENMRLLKQQVSLMQNAYESQQLKSERDINYLPLEILDMILQKSYLFCSMGTHGSTQSRDKAIFRKVASVDFCWFQRTKKPRFKRTIWRHLEVFYRNTGAGNTICRSSRSYLQQVVGSQNICLKSIEYPSDVQARQRKLRKSSKLQNTNSEPANMNSKEPQCEDMTGVQYEETMSEVQKKNSQFQLLHDIRFFDETRYSSMINCLRQAKLMNSARLVENGGVAVKVEMLSTDDIRFSERLVERLNELKDNTSPRLFKVEHCIRRLKSNDIEILDSFHQMRHADVWIWCKSQAGLAFLQDLYKSCKLTRVLAYLSNVSSLGFRCSIDKDQFKKEIVSRSVAIKFEQELDLQGRKGDHIVGVAKLPGKILVVSLSSQTVIQVFQDQIPFCLQKTSEHNEILWPVDIASSELQKCAYISDKESKCIWKVTSKTDDNCEVTKWCNARFPFTMSMCNDGRLVVVGNAYRYIGPVLEIYSSAVELLHSIVLPSDIQNPRHAVITSAENFVILHDFTNERSQSEIRISELTRHELAVLHSFTPLNKEQCLGVPYQLLLDSGDRVLVADHWNSRMILLDSDLTWNQSCTIKHKSKEKQRPKSIHYDEKNKQLIVAGNVSLLNGGVNVYALSWKTKTDAVSE